MRSLASGQHIKKIAGHSCDWAAMAAATATAAVARVVAVIFQLARCSIKIFGLPAAAAVDRRLRATSNRSKRGGGRTNKSDGRIVIIANATLALRSNCAARWTSERASDERRARARDWMRVDDARKLRLPPPAVSHILERARARRRSTRRLHSPLPTCSWLLANQQYIGQRRRVERMPLQNTATRWPRRALANVTYVKQNDEIA